MTNGEPRPQRARPEMAVRPRWFTEHGADHSARYAERFRRLARAGADLGGEARFVDALTAPASRILDAGCGPGRTGGELHRRGHHVLGVDVDLTLIDAARADHPGVEWRLGDLATLDLDVDPFDAAVLAGNVLLFVAPGTEAAVLDRIAAHVRPGGAVVAGFATDRHYSIEAFDSDVASTTLQFESRFSTWHLRPWRPEAEWAVTVLRVPER